MNMRGLVGKNVIVTGAAGGIGREICLRLGEEGCSVGVFDLNGEKAAEVASEVSATDGKGVAVTVDITDFDAVKAAVAKFEAEAGPTNGLVNNAGWDKLGNFLETGPDLWGKVIDINLNGFLHVTHAVASGMAERGNGKIVSVASDAGRVGSSGEGVYSACKGGIISFSKTLARELARAQINVNVVCPGPTDTPLFDSFVEGSPYGEKIKSGLEKAIPFRRLGKPTDLPGIIAFMLSDDADFITGQTISVSGGLTMAG